MKPKCLVLIDGEHYPPVIKQGLEIITREYDYNIVGGVFLGGTEKIGQKEDFEILNIPLIISKDIIKGVEIGIAKFKPDLVLDLSDEPIVGYRERFKIANVVVNKGIAYKGSDFMFHPPMYEDIVEKPSIMIAGTGKRVGKTAIGGYTARFLDGQEKEIDYKFNPCVITMGRGGPGHPEIIEGHKIEMNPDYFLHQASLGRHAASDHYEDALMGRVKTIGCRRCGGGFSGKAFYSIVKQGTKIANRIENDILVFEGSGATNPPVKTDACIMTVGAHQPLEYISGYMGPLRIMMSDLVILTMCESPMADTEKINQIIQAIHKIKPELPLVKTVFRPKPLKPIAGKKVIFCTTAPPKIGDKLEKYLETTYACGVKGISFNLSNRPELRKDLKKMITKEDVDLLLTEVKAASIDIATRIGVDEGLEIVYVDNIPVATQGKQEELEQAMLNIIELVIERFRAKNAIP